MVYIHAIIITIIILLQFYFFYKSWIGIERIKNLIYDTKELSSVVFGISSQDLAQLNNNELTELLKKNHFSRYDNIDDDYKHLYHKITLLNSKKHSSFFLNILNTVNLYIFKNRGIVADTKVIQEIVERSTEAEEEIVYNNISIPLYLGLMGTIIGIIVGLLNFSEAGGEIQIAPFLKSVSLAMGASALGLILTTWNNSRMSTAKTKLLKSKNYFYNFIQLNISSAYKDDFEGNVASLKDVVSEFNIKFDKSISTINVLFDKLSATVESQNEIADRLKSTDLNEFFRYNAKMLIKFDTAMERVETFSQYFSSINNMLKQTQTTTSTINRLLITVDDFKRVAQKLDSRIDDTLLLNDVVKKYIAFIEDNSSLFKSAIDKFGNHAFESLEKLNVSLANQHQEFVAQTMEKHRFLLGKINDDVLHLDKLVLLENIKDLLEKNNESQNGFSSKVISQLKVIDEKSDKLELDFIKNSKDLSAVFNSVKLKVELDSKDLKKNIEKITQNVNKIEVKIEDIKSPTLRGFLFGSKDKLEDEEKK